MWELKCTLWAELALGHPPSPESGHHRGPTGVGHVQGPGQLCRLRAPAVVSPCPASIHHPTDNLSPGRWSEDRDAGAAGKSFWKVTQKEAMRGEGGDEGTARIPRGVLLLCHGKCHGRYSWGLVFKGKNAAKPGGRFPTICPVLSCQEAAECGLSTQWRGAGDEGATLTRQEPAVSPWVMSGTEPGLPSPSDKHKHLTQPRTLKDVTRGNAVLISGSHRNQTQNPGTWRCRSKQSQRLLFQNERPSP